MTPQRLFFIALAVALSMTGTGISSVEASVERVHFNQNAMARSHHAAINARHTIKRSAAADTPGALRFSKRKAAERRATPAQRAAQARLNQQAKDFADKNAAWQAAAMEQLKAGKTPQTYEEFHANSASTLVTASSTTNNASDEKTKHDGASSDNVTPHEEDTCDEEETCDEDTAEPEQPPPQQKPASKGQGAYKTSPGKHKQPQEQPKQQPQEQPKQQPQVQPKQQHQQQHQQSESHSASSHSQNSDSEQHNSSSESSSSSSSTSGGEVHSGDGTYYDAGLGSCGRTNSNGDRIVAISAELYDSFAKSGNPNENPVCGKQIKATYGDGRTTTATVVDRCVGCAKWSLDFTSTGFQDLADLSLGRLKDVKWEWIGGPPA